MIQWLENHVAELLGILGYILTLAFVPLVLIRKRNATAAIAWCMAIIFLPYLGTFLYLLIGIPNVSRKIRKKQFHRSRFVREWIRSTADKPHHPQPPMRDVVSEEWQNMDRLAAVVGAVKMSRTNSTHIYHEGNRAFEDKMNAIREARHHIHAEYYILRADQAGRSFVEELCAKAREGVEVRLLVDGIGSREARQLLRKLRDAGGRAERFLPMAWRRRFVVNFRDHRKILICDGKVGFSGGLNIGDEYLGRTRRFGYWRDTQLRIRGPAVLGLQRVFVENWNYAHGEFLSGSKYFPTPHTEGEDKLQIIWSGPDQQTNAIGSIYFAVLSRARQRLWIATPYLVPDQSIMTALTTSAYSGVDVRIVTQSSPPDHWLAYFAGRYYWKELLDAGVRIYQYRKGMIHAKVIMADGAWASVGSANLDVRSLKLNFEVNCLIYSKRLLDNLESQFEQDVRDSRRVRWRDVIRRPVHLQLTENICRLFSPIL